LLVTSNYKEKVFSFWRYQNQNRVSTCHQSR